MMNQTIDCDVIRDLLPLYVDGAASADSCALVEEHLKSCEACRTECQALRETLVLPREDSAQPLKELRRTLRRRTIVLCLVLPVILFAGWVLGGVVQQHQEMINYGDALYVREVCLTEDPTAGTVTALPAGCVKLGILRTADQTSLLPPWDLMSINIDERYRWCAVWIDREANELYLEDPAGYYVRFVWGYEHPSERFQIQYNGRLYVNVDARSGITPPPQGSTIVGTLRGTVPYPTTSDPAGELWATNLPEEAVGGAVWIDPTGEILTLEINPYYMTFCLDQSVPTP